LKATADKIKSMGCDDLCTPLYPYDDEEIAEYAAATAADFEQYQSGGYTGA
jgi:hypothetical protein